MEKVPNLDMFSQRQLRKSNSLSRINHHDSSYRPSSSFQAQNNTSSISKNYYDHALKILNVDSQINHNLRNIDKKHDESWNKSNLKKVTKNQFERTANSFTNNLQANHQITFQNTAPQVHQVQHAVPINYMPPNMIRNAQNVQFAPVNFQPKPPQFVQVNPGFPYMHQQHLPGQLIQQHPVRLVPNQQFIPNTQSQLQRVGSAQNIHFRDYSQPDQVISTCKIDPVCNNEEEQNGKVKRQVNAKGQYTFRNQTERQSKAASKLQAVTLNPFLFDATYLLDIKQSESRLPDIALSINTRQYNDQFQKKKQLLEELIDIKETNQIEGNNILRQLDSLIEQFETNSNIKNNFDQSEFKNSRRSLFEKVH